MSRYELLHGDCLEKLKGLPDNSVDAVVTDPPAGIAFMGRSWDEDKGGRREWIAWLASIMGECLRVLKPGGHALVWALPRTSHWTATALEDAGFEVKDCVVHIFGSGFPKSSRVNRDPRFCQCGESVRNAANNTRGQLPSARTDTVPASFDGGPLQSNARNYSHAAGDFRVDCLPDRGLCDEQPRLLSVADQERLPLPRYVQAHTRSGERGDDLAHESFDTPSSAQYSSHPSNPDLPRLALSETDTFSYIRRHTTELADNAKQTDNEERPLHKQHKASRSWNLTSLDHGNGLPCCQACGNPIADGIGSALKPATEHWWLCRKKLTGTIAANVLEWGTGGINVDACRVATTDNLNGGRYSEHGAGEADGSAYGSGINKRTPHGYTQPAGRFPPNVLFSHLPECRQVGTKVEETVEAWECADGCAVRQLDEQSGISKSNAHGRGVGLSSSPVYGKGNDDWGGVRGHSDSGGASRFFPTFQNDSDEYECADGCPVKELDEQSGVRRPGEFPARAFTQPGSNGTLGGKWSGVNMTGERRVLDSGGASRFFPAFRYQAKAPPKERKVEGVEGQHPTQKPEALMKWLVRLVTPPNGVVLDPFTGSGTTGVAALLEGFRFIGCEREDEYYAIAKARLDNAEKQQHDKQSTLFDLEAS